MSTGWSWPYALVAPALGGRLRPVPDSATHSPSSGRSSAMQQRRRYRRNAGMSPPLLGDEKGPRRRRLLTAGRMQSRSINSRSHEGASRDSTHGCMVWALGVMMGPALLAVVGLTASKTAVKSASTFAAGAASGNMSNRSQSRRPLVLCDGPAIQAAAGPTTLCRRNQSEWRFQRRCLASRNEQNIERRAQNRDCASHPDRKLSRQPQLEAA